MSPKLTLWSILMSHFRKIKIWFWPDVAAALLIYLISVQFRKVEPQIFWVHDSRRRAKAAWCICRTCGTGNSSSQQLPEMYVHLFLFSSTWYRYWLQQLPAWVVRSAILRQRNTYQDLSRALQFLQYKTCKASSWQLLPNCSIHSYALYPGNNSWSIRRISLRGRSRSPDPWLGNRDRLSPIQWFRRSSTTHTFNVTFSLEHNSFWRSIQVLKVTEEPSGLRLWANDGRQVLNFTLGYPATLYDDS